MVRMRLQESAVLDEVREAAGLRTEEPAVSWPTPGQPVPGIHVLRPDVAGRGGSPAGSPGDRMRRLACGLIAVSGGVAAGHQALAGAFAGAHGAGPFGAAAALLAWPLPLLQPVLAGAGAVVLSALGVLTGGWRRLGPRQGWLLAGAAVAAILGAAPLVLVCTAITAVALLAVLAGLAI